MKRIILALIISCSSAHANDWTSTETTKETVYLMLHIVDWRQTRYIVKHPDKFYEINPLMKEHPTTKEVDRYFLISGLLHWAIVDYLGHKNRTWLQNTTLGIKTSLIGYNVNAGIKLEF